MNLRGSFILTGTAIAPVLLVYATVALVQCTWWSAIGFGGAGLILSIAGPVYLFWARSHLEEMQRFAYGRIAVADKQNLALFTVYLLPLLRATPADLGYVTLVPAIAIFLALALTGHNFHFNPLLKLWGWNFYTVETPHGTTYVLLSRRILKGARDDLVVKKLTPYSMIHYER